MGKLNDLFAAIDNVSADDVFVSIEAHFKNHHINPIDLDLIMGRKCMAYTYMYQCEACKKYLSLSDDEKSTYDAACSCNAGLLYILGTVGKEVYGNELDFYGGYDASAHGKRSDWIYQFMVGCGCEDEYYGMFIKNINKPEEFFVALYMRP